MNWDFFTPLLDTSFEHLRGDRERIFAFGKEMRCLTLFGEKRIGTKFVEYLLNARYFHKPTGAPRRSTCAPACCSDGVMSC